MYFVFDACEVVNLGPNFRNFPVTFSKDLPMSDDLGIPKKFPYLINLRCNEMPFSIDSHGCMKQHSVETGVPKI